MEWIFCPLGMWYTSTSNASVTIKDEHVTTKISNACTQMHNVIIYISITGQWKQ
jgi:hypothetical protein